MLSLLVKKNMFAYLQNYDVTFLAEAHLCGHNFMQCPPSLYFEVRSQAQLCVCNEASKTRPCFILKTGSNQSSVVILHCFLFSCLSVHLSDCLSACLSVLFVCPFTCLSVYLSVSLSICLSVRSPVRLPVYLPVCLSVCSEYL